LAKTRKVRWEREGGIKKTLDTQCSGFRVFFKIACRSAETEQKKKVAPLRGDGSMGVEGR